MSTQKKPDNTWIERSKNVLAQSYPGTNSKRWTQYVQGVYPSHTNGHGSGPYLYDAWGNRYLDFICALGASSLGYSHPKVQEAAHRQILKGASHSLPTTLEIEVAEKIASIIPSAEKMRFLKTGSEAASAAIRIARASTGKQIVWNDGYHGHADIFTSITSPALGVRDGFYLWDLKEEEGSFIKSFGTYLGETAAVIVESVKLDLSEVWQKKITELRNYCREHKIIFIIDEIITGFRVPQWTLSNLWNLDPDIILLGKGVANGFPLSIVAGKKEIMDSCEYFISSTFSGEAVSLAACEATIDSMHQLNFEDLMFYGKRLQSKLNALHPDIQLEGWGTRAMLNVTNLTTALFMQEMCKAGFLFGKAHFFNFAHLKENIESIVMSAAEAIVDKIKKGEVKLEGSLPGETFKR